MDQELSLNILIIESALLASDKPLAIEKLIELYPNSKVSATDIKLAIEKLNNCYEPRSFEIKTVASGYRLQLKTEYSDHIATLFEEKPQKYSRALLETLALIAYKQPITRGEIEEVRGVGVSSYIIRTLIERNWVRVVGYREIPGRPAMLATTRFFLDYFNIKHLNELPPLAEIKNLIEIEDEITTDNSMANQADEPILNRQIITKDENEDLFTELDSLEENLPANFSDLKVNEPS